MKQLSQQPVCLTIAGLDPSGGAGIIADIKTFSSFGCFATAAISSITFQNTTGVFGAAHQTADIIKSQIEPIVSDYHIDAVKTGMLPTEGVIEETARLIKEHCLKNIVVDPVVRSTSGFDLIDAAALRSLTEQLFPLSDIVTPNVPEAERISGIAIETEDDIRAAVTVMRSMGAKNILIKGGHLPIADLSEPGAVATGFIEFTFEDAKSKTNTRKAKDYLFIGENLYVFEADYIETTATHGTGCTLAAAIAANLALGKNLIESVQAAKAFVNEAIRTAPNIGHGHSPINIKTI